MWNFRTTPQELAQVVHLEIAWQSQIRANIQSVFKDCSLLRYEVTHRHKTHQIQTTHGQNSRNWASAPIVGVRPRGCSTMLGGPPPICRRGVSVCTPGGSIRHIQRRWIP